MEARPEVWSNVLRCSMAWGDMSVLDDAGRYWTVKFLLNSDYNPFTTFTVANFATFDALFALAQ
jgi:hypothetical protein